jgi:DnaJ-class molecular chaperone
VNRAYEVLGDEKLKRQYDVFGEQAISRSAARDASKDQNPQSSSHNDGYRELKEKDGAAIIRDQNAPSYEQADLDFYEVLGVSRDSDADMIKQAYIMLVKLYHPGKDTLCLWL